MAGLMKSAESAGYPMSDGQPDRLKVQLYDFQKSTYQWMLDQENAPGGINARFGRSEVLARARRLNVLLSRGRATTSETAPLHWWPACEETGLQDCRGYRYYSGQPFASLFVTDKDGGIWNREVSVGDVENTNGMWQSLGTYSRIRAK